MSAIGVTSSEPTSHRPHPVVPPHRLALRRNQRTIGKDTLVLLKSAAPAKPGSSMASGAQRTALEAIVKAAYGADCARGTQVLETILGANPVAAGRKSAAGRTLLQELDKLGTTTLAAGVDRPALMRDLLAELADPASVNQKSKATCTTASLQVKALREYPAEFVRVVTGLASTKGRVKLASGKRVARAPGTASDDKSGRTVSGRLFQSAMLAAGHGTQHGMTPRGVHVMTSAFFGRHVQPLKSDHTMLGRMAAAANHGNSVLVGIKLGTHSQEVLVTKVDAANVHYVDTHQGKEVTMSKEAFKAAMHSGTIMGD